MSADGRIRELLDAKYSGIKITPSSATEPIRWAAVATQKAFDLVTECRPARRLFKVHFHIGRAFLKRLDDSVAQPHPVETAVSPRGTDTYRYLDVLRVVAQP